MSVYRKLCCAFVLAGVLPIQLAAAKSTPFDQAIGAIRARDCHALGEIVNRGIDERVPALLYVAGVMYEEGLCVGPDAARARIYFDAGAQQGDRTAAIALGLHYALADGLPRSYRRAGAWLAHADGLELRALEGQSLGSAERERLQALKDGPANKYTHAVPAVPAEGDVSADWEGYLRSVHFLGRHLMKYPKRALDADVQGAFRLRVCPDKEEVDLQRLGPYRGRSLPSAETPAALRALSEEVRRAYREAQRILPRPRNAPDPAPCLQTVVVFRLP